MSHAVRYALLAVGAVPWLLLLVGQVLALIVLAAAGDRIGECLDSSAVATLATIWLALAPLPLGLAALLKWRRFGLTLLALGLPLCVFSLDKVGCPGSVLPFDDSEAGSVPVGGWMLLAFLAVLVCFGLVLALPSRRS